MPARAGARSKLHELGGFLVEQRLPGTVAFNRRIVSVDTRARKTSRDYLLPGFIDLQVNGAYGIDVMSAGAGDLLRLSHYLAHEGTTGWLPTVVTAPLDAIERCDVTIGEAMAAQAEAERNARRGGRPSAGATILGMHLEGPFISSRRLGAHPPLNLLPRGEPLERVLFLKTLRLITMAPELDGALEAIPRFKQSGITVAIGHTDATYEQAFEAVTAGARMFTHTFNAMPPLHHRAPGAAGAALTLPGVYAAVIPDGVHIHPAILRLVADNRGIVTSDRVALAGTDKPCSQSFGGTHDLEVREGAARRPDGTLTGSVVTMLDAVRTMTESEGPSWLAFRRAQSVASSNPAAVLGLRDRGRISVRSRADLVLLDRHMNLKAVMIAGREID